MKKQFILILLIACAIQSALELRGNEAPPSVQLSNSSERDHDEEELQRDLFLTFMTIAGTFGKILLDPNNTLYVIEGVANIIDSILFAADIATRHRSISSLEASKCSQLSNNSKFIQELAHYIQEQAQLMLNAKKEDTKLIQKENTNKIL